MSTQDGEIKRVRTECRDRILAARSLAGRPGAFVQETTNCPRARRSHGRLERQIATLKFLTVVHVITSRTEDKPINDSNDAAREYGPNNADKRWQPKAFGQGPNRPKEKRCPVPLALVSFIARFNVFELFLVERRITCEVIIRGNGSRQWVG